MNIKNAVYEAMDNGERVVAALKATQRDDAAEVQRLKRTAPRRTYSQIDEGFAGTMERVSLASAAFLLDEARETINLALAITTEDRKTGNLQRIANINEAKIQFLGRLGVPRDLAAEYGPPPHPLTEDARQAAPEPDMEAVEYMLSVIDETAEAWNGL
ncbi:hypothetical protein [Desulfobotulus mexicanus]|uniref:Uncharacterized protein n=1 Tax=Desulfobotulus mexicanus TaxID=2586642 RepID=A0A5S5MF53_9BACT|nr:hypothetical protein [Desulfobotulus mexicanus]TYT74318.1 hypothetical protein FIM25_10170 [Desulfobotulus mexicanus]